ncbi:unnamed protein product [Effrenium voratum]|uniref:Copia protein n=1 Tax=Effrenium voratum TaxID=2562239 RepID=A0AA36HYX7_9DINO|nr:unnamed protein product [Effrenium voratum]
MGKKDGSGNGPVAETQRWQVHGHLVVYVDDMMVCGPDTVVQGCLDRIASEWSCSPPEWVGRQDWTKFCGFELRWADGGLLLGQPSYIGELVHRHGVQQSRPVPFSKPEVPESLEVNAVDIKEAQGLVGELLWLSVRTRADISFGVSWMAQHITKCPQLVVKAAMEMIGYLRGTQSLGLCYARCVGGRGPDGALPFAHAMNRIELYADVSYAPGGGRSHQGVMAYYGGALVQWLSVRQAFTTLSTAEAELVGYLEAMTMGQSVAVVLGVLEGGAWDDLIIDVTRRLEMDGQEKLYGGIRAQAGASRGGDPGELDGHEGDLPAADREGAGDLPREDRGEHGPLEGRGGSFVVYGDNSSAITIIESADGPWRTRHLRLRAEVLREKVKCGRWAVRHLPGTRLVADYLTKAMTAKAQWPKFYELAGMIMAEPDEVEPPAENIAPQNLSKLKLAGLALVMGKVVNWIPDQAEDVMVKNLCLAALGGCPDREEVSTGGQPWFFERRVERPPDDDPRFSIEEEPEDFWDVEVNEREMVMTRIHMLPRHGDYQPRADALPPGASMERLEQRRQTNIVYEDMDLGRRVITDRWSEEAFRFRNAWRGATTFWMPLEGEVREGDAAVPQVRDADRRGGSRTRSLAPNGEVELSRPVRPRLQALRVREVKVMKAENLTLGPAGAGGDDPGGDWQPSIEEDPEDHWEVEFLPGNLIMATRIHVVERIRSYEPDRRDVPVGVFLEDFLDRRESFINPVNHREDTPRGVWGEVVDDNWRRDRWLREGWTGSSRFWVRPRRREIIFEVRPLTDQERQDEMDHDDTGDPGASGSGGASSSGATASMMGSATRPADTSATGDQKRPRTSRCVEKKESYVLYAVEKDFRRRMFILVVIFSMTVGTCAQNQEEREEDQMLWWIILITALLAGALSDPARMAYFKNMAVQSWKRTSRACLARCGLMGNVKDRAKMKIVLLKEEQSRLGGRAVDMEMVARVLAEEMIV